MEIESRSWKLMDISSMLKLSAVIDISIFSLSYGVFYSVTETSEISVYSGLVFTVMKNSICKQNL